MTAGISIADLVDLGDQAVDHVLLELFARLEDELSDHDVDAVTSAVCEALRRGAALALNAAALNVEYEEEQ